MGKAGFPKTKRAVGLRFPLVEREEGKDVLRRPQKRRCPTPLRLSWDGASLHPILRFPVGLGNRGRPRLKSARHWIRLECPAELVQRLLLLMGTEAPGGGVSTHAHSSSEYRSLVL